MWKVLLKHELHNPVKGAQFWQKGPQGAHVLFGVTNWPGGHVTMFKHWLLVRIWVELQEQTPLLRVKVGAHTLQNAYFIPWL
jgi:hypothetical protein